MSTRLEKALGLSLVAISLILVPGSILIVSLLSKTCHVENFAVLLGLIVASLFGLGLSTFDRAQNKEWREEEAQEASRREWERRRRRFEEEEWQNSPHFSFEGFYDFRSGYRRAHDHEENSGYKEKTYESSSYRSSSVEKAYRFFGLSYGAKESDVQREFRRLATIYHPDKPGGSEAKFKELVNNRDIIYRYLGKS